MICRLQRNPGEFLLFVVKQVIRYLFQAPVYLYKILIIMVPVVNINGTINRTWSRKNSVSCFNFLDFFIMLLFVFDAQLLVLL